MGKGHGKGGSRVLAAAGWGHTNTVVTETTYGEKMGGAMCGVCVGPVIYLIALYMVGWNEYHAVQESKAIDTAEAEAVNADCNTLSTGNQDKLIFLSCPVTGTETLTVRGPFAPPPPPGPAPPTGDPNAWALATALKITPKVRAGALAHVAIENTPSSFHGLT